jgi:hypothetical protein
MVETTLKELFERIFDLKVTLDLPGDMHEQDCLFVEVESSKNKIKDNRFIARVTGSASVFSRKDKLPIGYLSKAIANADPDDTKNLFFFDIENNQKVYRNIASRSFGFVYFFDCEYNPPSGTITSVTIEGVQE